MIWLQALPSPDPEPDQPSDPEARADESATAAEKAQAEQSAAAPDAASGPLAASEVDAAVAVAEPISARAAAAAAVRAARKSRWDKYRPRPAITLLTFAAGIAIGAGIFMSRIQPPPAPQTLPPSPYQSLNGIPVTPLPIAGLIDGLMASASRLPRFIPEPALGQLERVTGEYADIVSVEHQGTIVVDNQAISALVIRGFDLQGRAVSTPLTAYLVDGQIVEFR
jgi:hypothetical protein